jgi:hypothetical protein
VGKNVAVKAFVAFDEGFDVVDGFVHDLCLSQNS